jgi:hypothetical protein
MEEVQDAPPGAAVEQEVEELLRVGTAEELHNTSGPKAGGPGLARFNNRFTSNLCSWWRWRWNEVR